MNFIESNNHYIYERKPTKLEKKLQKIIDELHADSADIDNDKIEHNWKLVYIEQLQNIIYQIQINDINPVWERKEANED